MGPRRHTAARGVALVQWVTGRAASMTAVLCTIAGLLAAGTLAYRLLPGPAAIASAASPR
ncbi:hypothetical protein [Paracidovorax avenae]|uniref:hypothetical protein n=1 Tax=Paracidovorax avenae TaxID=80867 RepID=UPI0022B03BA1|nr:hypothetical protein [Paracidovorax avenae]